MPSRFGAEALLRMTRDALAGKETAYYPHGRERQRPATLEPRPAESPQDVVESLAHSSQDLDDVWRLVGDDAWETPVVEPAGNPVLGTLPLHRVTLMRWTEVEVHGTDLGLGLSNWHRDQPLVETGLLHTRANLAIVELTAGAADRIIGDAAQLIPDASLAACTEDPPRTAVGIADAIR